MIHSIWVLKENETIFGSFIGPMAWYVLLQMYTSESLNSLFFSKKKVLKVNCATKCYECFNCTEPFEDYDYDNLETECPDSLRYVCAVSIKKYKNNKAQFRVFIFHRNQK